MHFQFHFSFFSFHLFLDNGDGDDWILILVYFFTSPKQIHQIIVSNIAEDSYISYQPWILLSLLWLPLLSFHYRFFFFLFWKRSSHCRLYFFLNWLSYASQEAFTLLKVYVMFIKVLLWNGKLKDAYPMTLFPVPICVYLFLPVQFSCCKIYNCNVSLNQCLK